jgi:hypothetical protein
LEREAALHFVYSHAKYPNMSVTRWSSPAHVSGATDFVFEVDMHRTMPDEGMELAAYVPLIEAAVSVGKRVYDHLINTLSVDPRYITTTVTRMGARVTVDWRAFGPQRQHELLIVLRWVETQIFAAGEIAAYKEKLGLYMAEIDGGLYGDAYDFAPNNNGVNEKRGHWLRPLGALHSRSGLLAGFARATPVEHSLFRPDRAEVLTYMSRGAKSPNIKTWRYTHQWDAWRKWPEVRDPRFDHLIEANPNPSAKLIELFAHAPDLVDEVRDDLRGGLRKSAHPYQQPITRKGTERGQYDNEVLRAVAEHIGGRFRESEQGIQTECPRASCRRDGLKAMLYYGSGNFTCFRCLKGAAMSLAAFATEVGCAHLVPRMRHSTKPYSFVPRTELAPNPFADGWPEHTDSVTEISRSIEETREIVDRSLRAFLDSPDHRILFLTGATGTGKSTGVARVAVNRRVVLRVFGPRDEVNEQISQLLPDSVVIRGRREGENCWNEDLRNVSSLREDVAKTLCASCPYRTRCETEGYLSQFKDDFDGKHIVLHHNVGTVSELEKFSNGADVVEFVDEDSLGSVIDNVDLDAATLERFKVALRHDFELAEYIDSELGDDTIGLDHPPERAPSTPRLGLLIDRLIARISADAITATSPEAVPTGVLTDLQLARHLFADGQLAKAVREFNLWELAEVDDQDPEVEPANIANGPDTEAYYTHRAHLVDLARVRDANGNRIAPAPYEHRPPNVLTELVEALQHLVRVYDSGFSAPSPLQLIRTGKLTWQLRLTRKANFLAGSTKIIHATATAVPERMRLLYGAPGPSTRWMRVQADPPDPTEVTYVADRSYSKTSLGEASKGGKELRERLLETVEALAKQEFERTKLPVAVIGIAELINHFNRRLLGKLPCDLQVPFKGNRSAKAAQLAELTKPLGYICGYSYGTSGLNTFKVEENGVERFVRSLVLLGSPLPALGEVANTHRGLYALPIVEPERGPPSVDWTVDYRSVGYDGYPDNDPTDQDGGYALAQQNVMGFRDARANAILAGLYEAELIQGLGRMRGVIPDPVDPTLIPRAFVFAGVPLPGVRTQRVLGLEDVRAEVGLESRGAQLPDAPPGRKAAKPKLPPEETLRRAWKKHGWRAVLKAHYEHLPAEAKPVARTVLRLRWEEAALPWSEREVALLQELEVGQPPTP